MIANLGNMDPIILQVVILGLVGLGVLGGLRKGIWLMLFRIGVFIGFLVIVYLFTPVVANILKSYNIVEPFLGGFDVNNIPFLGSIFGNIVDVIYNTIASIGLVFVGMILNFIISIVLGFLFRKKSLITRLLGAGLGFAINGSVAAAILIVISSPLLFTNGDQWIDNSPGVKEFNYLVVAVQDGLCNANVPCRVEDLISLGLGAPADRLQSYANTINNLNNIISDPQAYINQAINQDGSFNEAGLLTILNDLSVISEIAGNFGLDKEFLPQFEPQIQEFLNQIPEGQTLEVPQSAIDDLQSIIDNLTMDPAIEAQLQNLINNQLIPKN
jgi:hypothetical protein